MKLDERNIERIGVWTLRVVLAVGAIYLSATGKTEAAGATSLVLIISFIYL